MKRPALLIVIALLASACAGPRAPFEVGSKDIPVDVLLGRSPQARPPALNPGPIAFPGFIQPPIPRPGPGKFPIEQPPARACPDASVFDTPKHAAFLRAPVPPAEATYIYRQGGTFQVGEAAPSQYPPTSERTVGNVRLLDDDRNFEFEVAIVSGDETTTTTYRVLNEGTVPDRGVFIVKVITESDEGTDAFLPTTPITLLPFPPPDDGTNLQDEIEDARGREYRSGGTDPISQTTMTLEARIADSKTLVNACGEWVDGIEVEVLSGRIAGPLKAIEFTGRYVIATQYGGLVVEDDIQVEGSEGLQQITSGLRARINRVPDEPRVPTSPSAA